MINVRYNTYFYQKVLIPLFLSNTPLKTQPPPFYSENLLSPYKAFLEKLDPPLKKGGGFTL